MKRVYRLPLTILIMGLIACGGNETKQANEKKEPTKENKEVEKVAEEVEEEVIEEKELIEINLIAKGENMTEIAFEPKVLNIPANSRVKLILENKSVAAGMLHNFVLVELGAGAEIATLGIKAGEGNNYVPDDERVIANTTMSKMGETVVVEFDAPAKGSYHYICSFPGHTSMIGRFNVQ